MENNQPTDPLVYSSLNQVFKERWNGLISRVLNSTPVIDSHDVLAELITFYNSPERYYHNFNHVLSCLAYFEKIKPLSRNPDAIELALIFHDVVYDSHKHDNEAASAQFASVSLARLGVSKDVIRQVEELIMATCHNVAPVNRNSALIMDIDLSILWQAPPVFDDYEAAIRKEYAWVSEEAYRVGRSQVLHGFIQRSRIYYTDYFRKLYEGAARENILRSLRKLGDKKMA